MIPRYLDLFPRRHWWVAGCLLLAASYIPWSVAPQREVFAALAPLVAFAACMQLAPRYWWCFLTTATIVTGCLLGFHSSLARDHGNAVGMSLASLFALACASLVINRLPWGYAKKQLRLTDRLRKQSLKLQSIRESQESTERTVQQIESDRRARPPAADRRR